MRVRAAGSRLSRAIVRACSRASNMRSIFAVIAVDEVAHQVAAACSLTVWVVVERHPGGGACQRTRWSNGSEGRALLSRLDCPGRLATQPDRLAFAKHITDRCE